MRKSSRESAKVFHEKDATLIAEKVCALKKPVGGWWEEKVDLTPCNGATPSESRIREIRTYGSMRGRRSKDLLLLYGMAMIQMLSPEIGKIVEKRHEMILAHEKFGVKIRDIIEEYGISVGAYYHWSNRYQ